MEKCWDSDPTNRPTIIMLEDIISEWIECINDYYISDRDGDYLIISCIDRQLEDDMLEFVKANEALGQKQANSTSVIQTHSQVYYKSRKISEILDGTECLDCMI
jgi:hypothetical protein